MFVLKSTHKALIAALDEARKTDCHQFESRISQLNNHIEDLRKLVFAPASSLPTAEMREADQILTPINDSPIVDVNREQDDILREQNRIFSGEYDQVS